MMCNLMKKYEISINKFPVKKKHKRQILARMWSKGNTCALLVGL